VLAVAWIMTPKRKDDNSSEAPSAREKKKQKVLVARTIAVQSVGPVNENAMAGPSRTTVGSMKGLPSAIDVEKFTEVYCLWLCIIRL